MTAAGNASLAAMALEKIQGGRAAQVLLHGIRQGTATPEATLDAMRAAVATGSESHLEGFARELQKAVERRA